MPGGGSVSAEQALEGYEPSALAPAERPRVALNMVATLDGHTTLGRRSRGLGNEGDRVLFHALRTRFDAVLAGAATVSAEAYGPLIRDPAARAARRARGLPEQPVAVIASRTLQLDPSLPLLADRDSRVIVLTSEPERELPACAARVEYVRAPTVGEALPQLGVRSVLCEGGPTLNGMLLEAATVDDLFLSLSPLLLGGPQTQAIVAGPRGRRAELELRLLLRSEQHLHARYELVSFEDTASRTSAAS